MSFDIGARYCIAFDNSALATKLRELGRTIREHYPDGVPNDVFKDFFGLLL